MESLALWNLGFHKTFLENYNDRLTNGLMLTL